MAGLGLRVNPEGVASVAWMVAGGSAERSGKVRVGDVLVSAECAGQLGCSPPPRLELPRRDSPAPPLVILGTDKSKHVSTHSRVSLVGRWEEGGAEGVARLWPILRGPAGTDARLILRRGSAGGGLQKIRVTLCRTKRGNFAAGTDAADSEVVVQT